jgi:hypothetical protein
MEVYNMRHAIFIILSLVFWAQIALGNDSERYTLAAFERDQQLFYDEYRSSDIENAESLLKQFLQLVSEYQKRGVDGIDYPYVLGVTYVRLYLIEEHKGNTEQADLFLRRGLKFHGSGGEMTESQLEKEKTKIVEFVKGIDLASSVKWINNDGRENMKR